MLNLLLFGRCFWSTMASRRNIATVGRVNTSRTAKTRTWRGRHDTRASMRTSALNRVGETTWSRSDTYWCILTAGHFHGRDSRSVRTMSLVVVVIDVSVWRTAIDVYVVYVGSEVEEIFASMKAVLWIPKWGFPVNFLPQARCTVNPRFPRWS